MPVSPEPRTPPAIVWGVELSPFTLKLQACLQSLRYPFRRLPASGGWRENLDIMARLELAKRLGTVERYPFMDKQLDEYPLVPYFSPDGKQFYFDSSAIARWLDAQERNQSKLFPSDPGLGFLAHLIDEAFDEFGLYLVHHKRWVGSAKSNQMGERLAREFKSILPPGATWLLRHYFPQRQVKRCPYLFSVAPKGFRCGVPRALTPPSRQGFPPTHQLLNRAWKDYLDGMETVLTQQPFLLGEQFTIADASAYGQLSMNLVDPEAASEMRSLAPVTYRWLENIARGKHKTATAKGSLTMNPSLKPLLATIMGTFSVLMHQNRQAYTQAMAKGESCFNEAGFNQGHGLYDGQLHGHAFRSVVKTFQVRVWNELCDHWQDLDENVKAQLREYLDLSELFELSP